MRSPAATTPPVAIQFSRDRLALVMEIEADRIVNLVLTEDDVATEREVVREERRKIENNPAHLLSEQVDAALYLAHPYGKLVIGWMVEVEGLGLYERSSSIVPGTRPGTR